MAAQQDDECILPTNFERIKMIGMGDVGRVFLVRRVGSDNVFAMKVLGKREMIARNKIKRCMTEREILATVDHPFIATLHHSFQTAEFLYFVMEFCAGGEFFRMLHKQPHKRLPEDSVRFYSTEVLLALEYLHSCGFIYRDLKPENILIHATGHVMLTDFDLAKQADKVTAKVVKRSVFGQMKSALGGSSSSSGDIKYHSAEPKLNTNSFVGTEEYIAPEVITGIGHSSSVDWWTFGVLVYEMAFGCTPFKGADQEATFSNITSKSFKVALPDTPAISSACKKMIKELLQRDPAKRLGAKHGASEIKRSEFFEGIKWQLARNYPPPFIPELSGPYDTSYFAPLTYRADAVLDAELPWAEGYGPQLPPTQHRPVPTVATRAHLAPLVEDAAEEGGGGGRGMAEEEEDEDDDEGGVEVDTGTLTQSPKSEVMSAPGNSDVGSFSLSLSDTSQNAASPLGESSGMTVLVNGSVQQQQPPQAAATSPSLAFAQQPQVGDNNYDPFQVFGSFQYQPGATSTE